MGIEKLLDYDDIADNMYKKFNDPTLDIMFSILFTKINEIIDDINPILEDYNKLKETLTQNQIGRGE